MEQEHKQRFKPNHTKCTINTASSSSSSSSSSSQDDEDNDNDIVCQSLSLSPSPEKEDLTHCLIMLSSSGNKDKDKQYKKKKKRKGVVFECKACKKVFTSYQALGGHRASHKNVKGCFAAKLYNQDNEKIIGNELPTKKKKKAKINMHECSICHRVFASGQALGGHKRCHSITRTNTIEFMKVNFDVPVLLPLMPNKIGSEIFLEPWMEKKKNIFMSDDDEIDCEIKLAKLSESSSWLQMGIGSSTNYDDG